MRSESLFTSDRERRLWIATLLVVVTIFSTLGLARTLSGALRERGILTVSFVIGMLLVCGAVAAFGLRKRPSGAEVGVALGVLAAYVLAFTRMASPEERSHLIEYGVVAVFMLAALQERAGQGRGTSRPALVAVAASSLVGVLDESVQIFLPSRVFDSRDILFNVVASVMAVVASLAIAGARRRKELSSGGLEN